MEDTQELILDLLIHARSGEHTKFEKLRWFSDYFAGCTTRRATRKVVEILEYAADNLFNKYCKAITKHQADVNLILAYKQLQQATEFYQEELSILDKIILDYEDYLWSGNFFRSVFLGEEREL